MHPFFYTNLLKQPRALSRFLFNVIVAASSFFLLSSHFSFAGGNDPVVEANARQWLSKQSERGFLENRGQMMDMEGNPVPFVLFKTESPGLNLWITETGVTFQTLRIEKEGKEERYAERGEETKPEIEEEKTTIHWERIDMELKGATIKRENITREKPQQGHFNYFYPHYSDGIYEVKQYEKITIKNVYPGIDWVWYSHPGKGYKYDFVVHPGADYKQIELIYRSKMPIKINEQGELELYTRYGNIREDAPVSFYDGKKLKTLFKQRYQRVVTINGHNGYETSISFYLPPMGVAGRGGTLVIDPQLFWATFYGGSGNDGSMSIDTDNSGNVFVTGHTSSTDFPVSGAFQGTNAGDYDVFILKFKNTGICHWATYYGGSEDEWGYFIATDAGGNVFVTGYTSSTDIPVHGAFFQGMNGGGDDAFILTFDNNGTCLWATYYGGSGDDYGYSIATDAGGYVFVTGYTDSPDFPVLDASTFFQGTVGGFYDAFILKFDNNGNRYWATYYGGNVNDYGYSIATDAGGNVFVTGNTGSTNFPVQDAGTFFNGTYAGTGDAFILKFDNNGNRYWATYYGGSGHDFGYSIATDAGGNVFVKGTTTSTNFPVQDAGTFFQGSFGGVWDAFILKFTNNGVRLWATYYGGSASERFSSYDNLVTDNCDNVCVSFTTETNPFPYLTNSCDAGYYDNTFNGSFRDVVLSFFSNSGTLLWCTYLGGDGDDYREALAFDPNNNLFVSGGWASVANSATYPVTDPGGGTYYNPTFNGGDDDGYIAKFINHSCICTLLPIELLAFQGECNNHSVKLTWQTASEHNNDYFTIERNLYHYGEITEGDMEWKPIGTVKGAGSSSNVFNYEFTDILSFLEVQNGRILHYRLRQADYNGFYKYYGPISVKCGLTDDWNLILQSIPTYDELFATLILPEDAVIQAEIFDVMGRKLTCQQLAAVRGSNLLTFDLTDTAGGVYFIRVRSQQKQLERKFVKQ